MSDFGVESIDAQLQTNATGEQAAFTFTVDASEAPEGFSLLPEGLYPCRIVHMEMKKTTEQSKDGPNHPYVNVTWQVFDGPGTGTRIYDNNLRLSQSKSTFRIAGLMKAIGFYDPNRKGCDVSSAAMLGREAWLDLKIESYTGKDKDGNPVDRMKNAVAWFNGRHDYKPITTYALPSSVKEDEFGPDPFAKEGEPSPAEALPSVEPAEVTALPAESPKANAPTAGSPGTKTPWGDD